MANIFCATVKVASEKLTKEKSEEIFENFKNNIAYCGECHLVDELYEGEMAMMMDFRWSLNYVKDYLINVAKLFEVEINARGEEENMCFYEVMVINKFGEIIKHESLDW